MTEKKIYKSILEAIEVRDKLLAILMDPDKFAPEHTAGFLRGLPSDVSHIFVGGSAVAEGKTHTLVREIKLCTSKPVILFPGDVSQLTGLADGLLFLSLLSGDNPEYLIGQQVKAVPILRNLQMEVIPTGYILIDGGNHSSVAQITQTSPIPQNEIQQIVDLALVAELSGKKMLYLEAGSGAADAIGPEIIAAVKKEITIPLIVGGGIRTDQQKQQAYNAGADMVVMGTAFESKTL